MKKLLTLLFITASLPAWTQFVIKGQVTDAERNRPIAGASIFLNNTSVGTTSGESGSFELHIPQGRYELIVSSIGYETVNIVVSSQQLQDFLPVKMKIRAPELEEVIITSYEKDGWSKWGRFFLDHFIGTGSESGKCNIINHEVLRFRQDKKAKKIYVSATEPLIIENKALGYQLTYDLVHFEYNFNTRLLIFTGYPFFEELEASASQQSKWVKKRQEVYEGSLMHFMRALFRNQMEKEGFVVRRLRKWRNEEKDRVGRIVGTGTSADPEFMYKLPKDSSNYYHKVFEQPHIFSELGRDVISGDSIAFAVDNQTVGFEFENHLHVYYKYKKPQAAYRRQVNDAPNQIISEISITGEDHIELKSNGMYYQSTDILVQGYWAWSEKISSMLPFNYELPKSP